MQSSPMPRLDQLLVQQQLAASRTRAQRLIKNGRVWRTDTRARLAKASEKLADATPLAVDDDPEERYVSRAGLKLEAVLNALGKRFDGQAVLDVGQSTGGFSDCALRFGARHVIGIEVGHGQLAEALRDDARVSCLEGINARALGQSSAFAELLAQHAPSAAVMDVSFISQTLILPEIAAALPAGGELISLVKPQFELDPAALDKRGVVRDPRRYAEVKTRLENACEQSGLHIVHWQPSPITGGDGNREFLLHALKRHA
ncbi:23S rRNA (cytidine1920-2'-O)/16S rRNA (cytidine1409-2'-O)-methyltransferase [Vreelandella subglaciescola]|uniref:23S rRNA (Cytidine1920-2'-O)/16S rRNA (Cytidine1409-2'-O)-methyltransferase n=2 Tax=Vreelandella subglaciescola TaxID=29571 RepID=A0A1M7IKN7_9GAMM|nr:23S rRNA (cytidine1920-2'-O)/16S rRNA (cytidine1409-2'-O)-methyltransferase [Halomonas subglaciescola]